MVKYAAALGWVAVFLLTPSWALPDDSEWRFTGVDRVVAVSDIHGAYNAVIATLQAADIIDDQLIWSGDATHLVVVGDILDRGPKSRQIIEMMIRLEQEAASVGGRVHTLLGNHEVMNLIGDTRYVSDEEYAVFVDEESAVQREYWYRNFGMRDSDVASTIDTEKRFTSLAPPGFFGHRRAFSSAGRYGRWLLEKPFMIVINDTAYVHGGLPPYVSQLGLANANIRLKSDLVEFMSSRAQLEDAGILSPVDQFRDIPVVVATRLYAQEISQPVQSAAISAIRLKESPLHRSSGPLWYRGSSTCGVLSEGDVLTAALRTLNAKRVVIGHTTTKSRQIQSRFDGRVIEVNTGMLRTHYGGTGFAAVLSNDSVSAVSESGDQGLRLVNPTRRVGERPGSADDAWISDALYSGSFVQPISENFQEGIVAIASAGMAIPAYFRHTSDEGYSADLAAYIVDQLVGLDMVPIVVRRTVSGQMGTLQLTSDKKLTETDRVESREPAGGPCPIERQHVAMRVFDALINNPRRLPKTMQYDNDDWELQLTSHEAAFSSRDNGLVKQVLRDGLVGPEWRSALERLSDDEIQGRLAGVVSNASISAFIERRDDLLQIGDSDNLKTPLH